MIIVIVMSYEANETYDGDAPWPFDSSYTYMTSWPTDIPADVKR